MGKATPHQLSDDVVTLGRAIAPAERRTLVKFVRALLGWQRTLGGFPRVMRAPNATPYVSLYARGKLRGCFGSHEGTPGERVVRAFMRSVTDTRYGGIGPAHRDDLAADVAYVMRAHPCRVDEVVSRLEPGVHGLAMTRAAGTTVLLPSVARERGHDAAGFVELLEKKMGIAHSDEGIAWILDVDEVSSRNVVATNARAAAKRFLESLVDREGRVAFEIDPGTGEARHAGTMRHGRIAVAIEALDALGSPKARAARKWLAREIARGLASGAVDSWPDRADMVLGTLALAARAGVEVPLADFAARIDPASCLPWHAAQAAAALGPHTPEPLWSRCVSSLDSHPFSPYALMAARARDDGAVIDRCARAIEGTISREAPFIGGARITAVPETALTAAAAESLAGLSTPSTRRAVREFILARQVLDVPAALHPSALGAFRASPIAPLLRCDVSAHAALAAFTPEQRQAPARFRK